MFIRACYKTLAPRIWPLLQHTPGVALLGTPGIGKSLFGILVLIEVLQWLRQKKVVKLKSTTVAWPVVYATEVAYYIFTEDCTIRKADSFRGTAGFLILDGKAPYDPQSTRACIWLSSPRPETLKTINREGFRPLYMPPWTADELVDCWKQGCASTELFYKEPGPPDPHWEMAFEVISELGVDAPDPEWQEAVLRHWVNELGPVPRRAFLPGTGVSRMRAALADEGDYSSLLRAYQDPSTSNTDKFPHSHTLLLMIPIQNNKSFVFAPATTVVARRVLELKGENDLLQAQTLMGKMSGAHLGHVFQPCVEHMLSTGGNFDVRSLEDNSPSVMDIAPCTKKLLSNKQFDELKESKPNTLYIPEDPDFPAVDCWTNNVMFQATVSHNHPIASAATRFLKLRNLKLVNFPRIVFVVPKHMAGDFRKQPFIAVGSKKTSVDGVAGGWNDIEQYVLGV